MPSLRCPECYYATTFRKDAVSDASCHNCGENLFKFYYEGKSQEESKMVNGVNSGGSMSGNVLLFSLIIPNPQ